MSTVQHIQLHLCAFAFDDEQRFILNCLRTLCRIGKTVPMKLNNYRDMANCALIDIAVNISHFMSGTLISQSRFEGCLVSRNAVNIKRYLTQLSSSATDYSSY
jgi:hypothetical protein